MADVVVHDKLVEFKTVLEDSLSDARKFDEVGNKSAATRVTVMLNNMSKETKILRQKVLKMKRS